MAKSEILEKMKVRRLLMKEGIGQDVSLKYANVLSIETLQGKLESLFLEPIPIQQIEFFYKLASEKGYYDMNKAFKELEIVHREEPNRRFLNIALTL